MTGTPPPPLRVLRPPFLVPYPEALALQHRLLAQRTAGGGEDTLLLLQHPPVITLGRHADPAGVLAHPAELATLGVDAVRVERGGQATYHGPGQWVAYPILDLRRRGLGVRRYVAALEEVLLSTCAHFGVAAQRRPGRPGLFTAAGKLAAIGIAVRRGISFHGCSLNVCPDLTHYSWIVPCGLTDVPATSLARERGEAPKLEEVARVMVEAFQTVFAPPGAEGRVGEIGQGQGEARRDQPADHAPRK